MRKVLYGTTTTLWAWVLTAPWRWPQGDGEQVGENVGNLLGGWAKSLYVGIAAVVALVFLLNRRFADLAVFMVAALLVGGFVMAPERHRGHDARHLADDHGLMAERVVIRSYRRVFEVDRRIYRVDRWALPVPGGVPLRAVGYFTATVLLVVILGGAARDRRAGRHAVAAAALRGGAAGGRGARHAGGAGRAHGAPLRLGLAAAAAARAAPLRRSRRWRSRASRSGGTAICAVRWDGDGAELHRARVRGPARVTFNVPSPCTTSGDAAGAAPAGGRAVRGEVLEVRP